MFGGDLLDGVLAGVVHRAYGGVGLFVEQSWPPPPDGPVRAGGPDRQRAPRRRARSGGQSNREIAEALFVTPKNVELHLRNAYRKLGISSRRQLPAELATP